MKTLSEFNWWTSAFLFLYSIFVCMVFQRVFVFLISLYHSRWKAVGGRRFVKHRVEGFAGRWLFVFSIICVGTYCLSQAGLLGKVISSDILSKELIFRIWGSLFVLLTIVSMWMAEYNRSMERKGIPEVLGHSMCDVKRQHGKEYTWLNLFRYSHAYRDWFYRRVFDFFETLFAVCLLTLLLILAWIEYDHFINVIEGYIPLSIGIWFVLLIILAIWHFKETTYGGWPGWVRRFFYRRWPGWVKFVVPFVAWIFVVLSAMFFLAFSFFVSNWSITTQNHYLLVIFALALFILVSGEALRWWLMGFPS